MIRFINCMRRKSGLTDVEFREYWNSPEFESLVQKVAGAIGAVSVARRLTLQVPQNEWITLMRGTEDPYDATLEYMLENAQQFEDIYGSDEFLKLVREMLDYQNQFIDQERSSAFFTEG